MVLVASNESDPTNGDLTSVDINKRQAEALERLVDLFDPKRKPRKRFALRVVGYVFAGVSAAMGLKEVARLAYESYLRRETITHWVEASRETYVVEGDSASALELLKKADEFDQQNPSVIKLMAYIDGMQTVEHLFNLDRPFMKEDVAAYGKAQSNAIMLQNVQPDDPDWAILRGQLALVVNEPERAKVFLEKALQLDPKNDFAMLRMALIHRKLALKATEDKKEPLSKAEWGQCQKMLDQTLQINPKSKFAMLWQGTIELEDRKDPAKAKKWFEKAIEVDQRFVLAWQSLGETNKKSGDLPAAEKAYLRTLEIRPNVDAALTGLAYVYGAQDQYEIGLRYARLSTDMNEKSFDAWIMRGLLAFELANLGIQTPEKSRSDEYIEEAIKSYSKALDLNPRNGEAYWQRSALYRKSGKLDECFQDATNAVLFEPNDARAWNSLARCYEARKLHAEAIINFGEAIARDPTYTSAYLFRAKELIAIGNMDDAWKDFELALEHPSKDLNADIRLARGLFQVDKGNLDAALTEFIAARDADPNLFEAWKSEARTLRYLNRIEESKAAARHALAIHNDAEVEELLNGSPSTVGGAPSAASAPVKSKNP